MTTTSEAPSEPGRDRIKYRVKKRRVGMFAQSFLDTRRGRRFLLATAILSVLMVLVVIWYITPRLLGSLGDTGSASTPESSGN